MTRLSFKNKFSPGFLLAVFLPAFFGFPPKAFPFLQVNQVILVDDYDDEDWVNQLGGRSEGDEEFPGGCIPRFLAGVEAFGKTGASLVLDYDVKETGSFSYFWSKLGKGDPTRGTGEPINLTEMRYLSFWMKAGGDAGSPRLEFHIELHEDTNGDQRFVLGEDTSDRIPASRFRVAANREGWQKIVIPLSRFRQIRQWERILEISFIFENRWRIGRGSLFVDNLLFGSNYPEELEGTEIPMQNRVSSFKIGNRIASDEMKLKRKPTPLTLTLTFVDPYLEEIRFEESVDGGKGWKRIHSFYDHSRAGVYESETSWGTRREAVSKEGILLRAVGQGLLGNEVELAGPYRIYLD